MPRRQPSPRARRIVVALVVVCLGLTTVAAPALAGPSAPAPGPGTLTPPDPYFPQLGNRGYDVEHYDLGLAYDPADRILHGDTKIAASTDRLLRRFNLDLTGMTVRRVDVDGKKAPFTRSGSELVITPRAPVAKGADFTVRVRYDGQPEVGEIAGLGASNAWLETADGAVTLNEPDGASHMFPGNDHPSDKATFTFRLTVPTGTTAVANGTLQRRTTSGASTTFVWDENAPMATYLTQVAIGDLTIVDGAAVDGVKIRNAYAPNIRGRAELAAAQTPEMLRFLSAQLGPFPFDTYGVLVPDGGPRGLAFEAQTFSLFAPDIFGDAGTASAILAHELTHQWFGDWVSPATWQETWLNEGFATYFEWAWDEHEFDVPMASSAADAVRAVARDPQTPTDDPGVDGMFGTAPYERGGLTLYALRLTVGDATFSRILRVYLARYGGETASTADFIKIASDVAGQDLGSFFRTWLGPGPLPPLPPATLST